MTFLIRDSDFFPLA